MISYLQLFSVLSVIHTASAMQQQREVPSLKLLAAAKLREIGMFTRADRGYQKICQETLVNNVLYLRPETVRLLPAPQKEAYIVQKFIAIEHRDGNGCLAPYNRVKARINAFNAKVKVHS